MQYINKEKNCCALSDLPSPILFETRALPPVPNIKPIEDTIIIKGIIRLTEAKGVFPTKLETKNPSTILYNDVKTIIIIDGNVKRNSLL